jgi:hypothetical protein
MDFLAAIGYFSPFFFFFFNIHIVYARDGWCEVEEGLLCISLEKMSGTY